MPERPGSNNDGIDGARTVVKVELIQVLGAGKVDRNFIQHLIGEIEILAAEIRIDVDDGQFFDAGQRATGQRQILAFVGDDHLVNASTAIERIANCPSVIVCVVGVVAVGAGEGWARVNTRSERKEQYAISH